MQNTNEKALAVTAEVSKAVLGKPEVVLKIMMAILARGHVLIEDIPGVGKTTLAQAFARAMNLTQNRVQFTPDVLPSDIVGFSLYQKETGKFVYHPGAVACNLFLADEINRTSARESSTIYRRISSLIYTSSTCCCIASRSFLSITGCTWSSRAWRGWRDKISISASASG